MPDLTTLGLFAQYFLGLYFIGQSITVTRSGVPGKFTFSVDWFKLVFGICLLVLSVLGKVL